MKSKSPTTLIHVSRRFAAVLVWLRWAKPAAIGKTRRRRDASAQLPLEVQS